MIMKVIKKESERRMKLNGKEIDWNDKKSAGYFVQFICVELIGNFSWGKKWYHNDLPNCHLIMFKHREQVQMNESRTVLDYTNLIN